MASSITGATVQFTPPLADGRPLLKVGLLHKKGRALVGGLGGAWALRLCALTDRGEIEYFEPGESPATKTCASQKQYRGVINCRESVIRQGDATYSQGNAPGSVFTVQPAATERCYELAAETLAERDEWIAAISQFGDGPSNARAKPNAKAKLLLFGEAPASSNGGAAPSHKELRTLGVTEATYDRFGASEKLYRSLGAFEGTGRPGHTSEPSSPLPPSSASSSSSAAIATPASQPVGIDLILAARTKQSSPPLAPNLSPSLGTLASGGQVYTCGWLTKLGGSSNSGGAFGPRWQERFVVLTTAGLMLYWKSEADTTGKTKGVIDTNQAVVRYMDQQEFSPPRSNVLSLLPTKVGSKKYVLAASTLADRDHWIAALSYFGDGPTQVSGGGAVGSKAKDILYGSHKSNNSASLDRLGTTQKTVDLFVHKPKAFAKLGIFDEDQPLSARAQQLAPTKKE